MSKQPETVTPETDSTASAKQRVMCECLLCGWQWFATPATLANGGPAMCPTCKSKNWNTGRRRIAHKKNRKKVAE